MADVSPLWPATLHHFRLNAAAPAALIDFYRQGLGMTAVPIGDKLWHLAGPERRLLIGKGEPETVSYTAFAIDDADRLTRLERHVSDHGIAIEENPSPLFGNAAFSIRDPDGQRLVFGVPPEGLDAEAPRQGLAGRTQHIVFATSRLPEIRAFYRDHLGFLLSDEVVADDGVATAAFFRSDREHHSYAAFRAGTQRYDHHAMEAGSWNDLRDWADHFAKMRVPIWWGPGRHGPGNNLFIMVRDPEGNRIELSAELELMEPEATHRAWPHEDYTLNLWGSAWMRS